MSKITMLEPVAWRIYRSKRWCFAYAAGRNLCQCTGDWQGLVTTDQAEAYAAAKVREALEEAEEAVTTLYESEELPLLPDIAKAINACMTRGKQ